MIDYQIENKIRTILKLENADEIHAELVDLVPNGIITYTLLNQLIEMISCIHDISIDEILSQIKLDYYNQTELSIITSYQAIEYFQDWNIEKLDYIFKSSIGRSSFERINKEAVNAQAFMKLIARLFMYRLQNPHRYQLNEKKSLFVIGDSHSLVLDSLSIPWDNETNVTAHSMLIRGVKMYHLGNSSKFLRYRKCFISHLKVLPSFSDILLSIGEIDCRPNEGMYIQLYKQKNVNMKDILQKTVAEFIEEINSIMIAAGVTPKSITLMGIPYPRYDVSKMLPPKLKKSHFFMFIEEANTIMCNYALNAGWQFLDLFTATKKITGNISDYYLDEFHLSPSFYDNVHQWIIKK